MDDHDKLVDFIERKIDFGRHCGFNLEELRQLRELVQAALIQRLCESAPLVYKEIFQEREKL